MSASKPRPRHSDSALRAHVGCLSLLLSFASCTHHPMVQKMADAREDGFVGQSDVGIDQAPPGPDAGIDIGSVEDAAALVDGLSGAEDGSGDIVGGTLEVAATDVARPSGPIRVQKLTGNTRFNFGSIVAISGGTIAIASGASNRVYFFDRTESGWSEAAVIELPTVAPYSSAVQSLAMDGDVAAVGTTIGVSVPGWVHVLRRTAGVWTVEARIDDPFSESKALFGCSVGVASDTIVVGADRDYDGKPGSAHVFVKGSSGWEKQGTLESSSDGTPAAELADDKFGWSVAILADAIAVTRPRGKNPSTLLFRRESGVWRRDPLFQPDGTLFDQPLSVALDGESLIVGDNGRTMGFVYRNGGAAGWALDGKLTARPQYNLGYSVALTGRLAVMGGHAPGGRSDHGDAYAFVRSQAGAWSSPIPLLPEGEPPPAGFGSPVAASGSTIVVGAPFATEGDVETGAAYVFDFDLSGVP